MRQNERPPWCRSFLKQPLAGTVPLWSSLRPLQIIDARAGSLFKNSRAIYEQAVVKTVAGFFRGNTRKAVVGSQ